jgi:hypothetical protein
MKNAQGKRSHLARMAVTVAVVLVAVAVLAGPALAAADHTEFTTTYANNAVVNYGGGTLISTVLMDTTQGMALGGLFVDVEQSTVGASGPWDALYIVTTGTGAYDSGTYTGPVVPMQNTWYHFVWAGSPAYATSTSEVLAVQVKPLLGKPSCPAKVKHGKKFTVKGTLNPMFQAGTQTVTIKAFKMKKNHKWGALKKTYMATNGQYMGYTPYSVKIKFSKKGKYRFQALTATTATWAAVSTGYSRTLTVK